MKIKIKSRSVMAKEEKMATLTIDGVQVSVPPGTMIVDAAAKAGIRIPTLCNNKRLETGPSNETLSIVSWDDLLR